MAFKNPFLSISGQVERLKNVKEVLAQSINPFSKAKPVAAVENKVLKAGLEFVAASPYTAAALATGVVGLAKVGATGIITKVAATTLKTKIIGGAAVLIGGGILIKSPTAQAAAIKAAGKITPESLLGGGGIIGEEVETIRKEGLTLESGLEFIKAHPYLTATTAAIALATAGYGAVLITSIISKYYQTAAAKKYLEEQPEAPKIESVPESKEKLVPEKELKTDEEKPAAVETTTIQVGKRRRRKAKVKQIMPSVKQSMQVFISNRNSANRVIKNYLKERIYA